MNRREFLKSAAGASSGVALAAAPVSSAPTAPVARLGVCQYSFGASPHTHSTLDFLEYCHSLGAGGVQAGLDSVAPDYTGKIRRRAEELGMYFEAIVPLSGDKGPEEFERQVAAAREAGATCLRSACLSGRRYEDFSSLGAWKQFVTQSHRRIAAALPILAKHRMPLGIENHKDWTADELAALVRQYDSEYLGVCLDTGNNISLLDDPMRLVESLAPYVVATHFKDMAAEEYVRGFLLAEVPLGRGMLDLRRTVETIHRARPGVHFSLEMITRDPLKVPCLEDPYWVTFPDRGGLYLARTLRLVRGHKPAAPLPRISELSPEARRMTEEANVISSLHYARERLGMSTL